MLKMAAILKSNMAATGMDEKNGNNLIWVPGSLLYHLRPKAQIVHEPPTNNISNQTKNRKWMCLPNLQNLTFFIPIFSSNYPPISVPFSIGNHPILPKLDAFYNNFLNIKFLNLGFFISDENPPITIPNFMKKHLRSQANICILCQCEILSPPPPPQKKKNLQPFILIKLHGILRHNLYNTILVNSMMSFNKTSSSWGICNPHHDSCTSSHGTQLG